MALASTVAGLYSLWLAHQEFGKGFDVHNPVKVKQACVLPIWILAPPIWFWIEYFFVYGKEDATKDKPALEAFKYGQDQASKIWLALVTVLFGLYFGKDLIRDSSPPSTQGTQQTLGEPQSRQGIQSAP
jgi:hypothetical protein